VLWNGFEVAAALRLPTFSCAAAPSLYPINPSLSSSFFFLPQILQATINRPPRMAAPPIPTTTPMIVLFVLDDMPEPLLLASERDGLFVDFEDEVDCVEEETEVTTLRLTVWTMVDRTTVGGAVVLGVVVSVVALCSDEVDVCDWLVEVGDVVSEGAEVVRLVDEGLDVLDGVDDGGVELSEVVEACVDDGDDEADVEGRTTLVASERTEDTSLTMLPCR
jgi:hypothetical protein